MTDAAESTVPGRAPLPVGATGRLGNGWYGMWAMIATEAALFGFLLFSYFYLLVHADTPWPPDGLPSMKLSVPNTVLLFLSSVAVWWGERGIKHGVRWIGALGLFLAILLGSAFLYIQSLEWAAQSFGFADNAYSSLFFTVTGFHGAHVIVGVGVLLVLLLWTLLGYFDARRHAVFSIGVLYWHFVDIVWIFVFSTFYLSPYVLR
jgi:cytochrome c oxidase subunit 3